LEEAGVQSVVLFPLRFHQETLGFIWATNFDIRNTLEIKETLELTTFFISSQIANYNMIKRLEHISYTDLLTGVNNRNAMNNRITGITEGTEHIASPFGVVFADLNGLKTVNDSSGHFAGDLLLRKAAIVLQEVFTGDEIFRAGGDEFMVIISGCTEAEFLQKVEILRKRADSPNTVSFAVGSYFSASGCDIRDALHKADEDMYANKQLYYTMHPERKLR
jgi:diguanylate cyclase (GGDEF)-like protein